MRQLAFAIAAVLGGISFFLGLGLVGIAYKQTVPIWVFGRQTVNEQQIRVVKNHRHNIYFSNDPSKPVPKKELGWFNTWVDIATFATIIVIFYLLSFTTSLLLKRLDAQLANEFWLLCKGKTQREPKLRDR